MNFAEKVVRNLQRLLKFVYVSVCVNIVGGVKGVGLINALLEDLERAKKEESLGV